MVAIATLGLRSHDTRCTTVLAVTALRFAALRSGHRAAPLHGGFIVIPQCQTSRYLFGENFVIGIRWADRAPALASPTFGFHQRQTWGYFTIVGTTSLLGGRPRPPL